MALTIKDIKTIHRKIALGAMITDEELEFGLTFWHNLTEIFLCLGTEWQIAFEAANRRLETLHEIQYARSAPVVHRPS